MMLAVNNHCEAGSFTDEDSDDDVHDDDGNDNETRDYHDHERNHNGESFEILIIITIIMIIFVTVYVDAECLYWPIVHIQSQPLKRGQYGQRQHLHSGSHRQVIGNRFEGVTQR